MEILQFDFMRRALVIGGIISLICPTIGLFLVLRRFSMLGDTLSHVSLAGVAIGMVTGIYPIYTAIGTSILVSIGIDMLRKYYEKYAELTLSIFMALGIGVASILINLYSGRTSGIMSYLFGSISLVTSQDTWIVLILGTIILISIAILYRGLFFTVFDEEAAKLAGVNTSLINIFFSVMIAVTITISMRVVGILLVSSLIVLPVASSLQVARSFKHALFLSNLFGIMSVITGLFISFYMDIAPGGAIIMVSILLLILVLIFKLLRKLKRTAYSSL